MSRALKWIFGLGMIAAPAITQAQTITFYENNDCRGKVAFVLKGPHPVAQSCKGGASNCRNKNDVARSVRVEKPTWMTVRLFVYDDPYGGTGDDWAWMTFHPNSVASPNMCIRSFETNQANPSYETRYNKRNGLDGKVSYVSTLLFGRQGVAIH